MNVATTCIPVEYIRECFDLSESGQLFWKDRPQHHFPESKMAPNFNGRFAGKLAGWRHHTGYIVVSIAYNGRQNKVLGHRIVWVLVHGRWPSLTIDHINRQRDDNRPANLRDVTSSENQRNTSRYTGGARSPLLGVYPRGKSYLSQIKRAGRIRYLGTFDTPEAAHNAFLAARAALDAS